MDANRPCMGCEDKVPGCSDHCMYIGEGDFICDKKGMAEEVFVMCDWEFTDDFMWCMSGGEPSGN